MTCHRVTSDEFTMAAMYNWKKNPLAKNFIVHFFFFFTFVVHNSYGKTVARCDAMGYFVCLNKRRTF